MNFLPQDFEYAAKIKAYWKPSEMPQGESRFRIVQKPIAGWIDWKDGKPYRYTPKNKPSKPADPEKEIKAFWALYVWDYARKDLFILEITQAGLIKSLIGLAHDEEWGDFTKYDLKIRKEGSAMTTKYQLSSLPPKPLAEEIRIALKEKPAYLEALYAGGDPWADRPENALDWIDEPSNAVPAAQSPRIDSKANKGPSSPFPERNPLDELKERLELESIPTNRLEEWIKLRAQTTNESADLVIQSCLEAVLYPKFAQSYMKWLSASKVAV